MRLEQLRYRCLELRSEQRVLVGEAGAVGSPTVLLVHGLGDNAHRDWSQVIPALTAQFHVVALDLPGFGESMAVPQGYSFDRLGRTLAEVLDSLTPGKRVHLVGHSLGASISLFFAHVYPARVNRLVLVDTAGILHKSVFAQNLTTVRMPRVGIAPVDRFAEKLDEFFKKLQRSVFRRLDNHSDFGRWLAQNPEIRHALFGRHIQIEAALGLVEHDFSAAIRETSAPTTIIWGARDPVAPLRTGKLLEGRMPNARLEVIDGVGHSPMMESAEAFNRLLLTGLTAPPGKKDVNKRSRISQGSVVCRNQSHARYSGVFDSITLDRCEGARIDDAQVKQLTLMSSSLSIENSVIDSNDVAVAARQSEVIATNVMIRGRVAIRTEYSRLDLAGVSLRASERGVEMQGPSEVFFSVSDWFGPDHSGDAHFILGQDSARR